MLDEIKMLISSDFTSVSEVIKTTSKCQDYFVDTLEVELSECLLKFYSKHSKFSISIANVYKIDLDNSNLTLSIFLNDVEMTVVTLII